MFGTLERALSAFIHGASLTSVNTYLHFVHILASQFSTELLRCHFSN